VFASSSKFAASHMGILHLKDVMLSQEVKKLLKDLPLKIP
jgi:hypothetical protein